MEMFDEFLVRMWRFYLSGSIANVTRACLPVPKIKICK